MEEKKKRGCNFSLADVDLLMQLILADVKVIENKITDGCSQKEKHVTWKKITENFNSMTGTYRDLNSVKIKYENIKRNLKKKILVLKQHQKGTGGGPDLKTNFLWYEEQLYGQLKLGIEGLPSVGDSDSVCIDADNELMPNETPASASEENIYVLYDNEQDEDEQLEESHIQNTLETFISSVPAFEVKKQKPQIHTTPRRESNSHCQSNVAGSTGVNLTSKNWNLRKRPRVATTRQQKLEEKNAFQKLAETKREMCIVQKECYELESKEKILEAERKKEEWELKRRILEAELAKKLEEQFQFSEERTRRQTLHELAEEEMKLKLELMKCELNMKLKKSLS